MKRFYYYEHTVQLSDRECSWLCLMTEVQEALINIYAWCKDNAVGMLFDRECSWLGLLQVQEILVLFIRQSACKLKPHDSSTNCKTTKQWPTKMKLSY